MIETVEFKQRILGRILGYGDVYVVDDDGACICLNCIKNPKEIKNKIDFLIDNLVDNLID